MTNIYEIKQKAKNADVFAKELENVIERLQSGETRAIAIVEVMTQGRVGTAYGGDEDTYHHLNSGCATLAARVALGDEQHG